MGKKMDVGDITKAKKELDYIMTSIKGNVDDQVLRDKVVSSIIRANERKNFSSIEETTHYKLATVLKYEPANWKEFKELVRTELPGRESNGRVLLRIGRLPWKVTFKIPECIMRESRRKNKSVFGSSQGQQSGMKDVLSAPGIKEVVDGLILDAVKKSEELLRAEFIDMLRRHIHRSDRVQLTEEL